MHQPKKYVGKIEKTIYVVETVEIITESEEKADEILQDISLGYEFEGTEILETEIQEEKTTNTWIDSSEPLGTDEFMEYKDNL